MNICGIRSRLVLGMNAIACDDSQGVLGEYDAQGIGGLTRSLNVALTDVVGHFDSHPDHDAIIFALCAKNEVRFTDPGFLRVSDEALVKGIINRLEKFRAGVLHRALHHPRLAKVEPLTEKRPNPSVEFHFQNIPLEHCDIGFEFGDIGFEHRDIGFEFYNVGFDALQAYGYAEKFVGEQRTQQEGLSIGVGLKFFDDASH